MARKSLRYKIEDQGRDFGKVFVVTEMSARRADAWAVRVLFAIMNGGVEVPEDFHELGMAGLAAMGLQALGTVPGHIAQPLLDELLECVQIMPDPNRPEVIRNLVDDDTEEVLTLFKLRKEAFLLHVNFSLPEGQSTSGKSQAETSA
jgi:hypothetical protein